jgi:hypothetical protein
MCLENNGKRLSTLFLPLLSNKTSTTEQIQIRLADKHASDFNWGQTETDEGRLEEEEYKTPQLHSEIRIVIKANSNLSRKTQFIAWWEERAELE